MPQPQTPHALPGPLDALLSVPRLLRDPQAFYDAVQADVGVPGKAIRLAFSSFCFLFVYGFVTGWAHSPLQALYSGLKMPILFLTTMLFCLPALYFFSLAVLGTRLGFWQAVTVVLGGIGVTSFLLLGLAPVTLFFVLTSSDQAFFQLLAVAFVAISGYIGLYFLWGGMALVDETRTGAVKRLANWILRAWTLLYGFVGSQMAWRLSPFIGEAGRPAEWVQPSRDNFYVDVIRAVQHVVGVNDSLILPTLVGAVLFGIALA
ncbi:MAG TPA: hypothetical protein PK954_00985, partial [Anaerolineales bacterium]|nr:hypothetical protein [Anaerolineales bacterium]